jgi:DHA2 family multidrug resistance protein
MATEKPIRQGLVTVSIMMATVMQAVDTTIANVALPHMQGSLNATQEQASWILTSYIVAAAIMTAPTGFLAGRYGRKKVFAISVAGFVVASMLCGMVSTLPEIVFFRLLQGLFGAALVPLSQAVLLDINPPEKHGQAMAMWGVGVMVGPILGPMLGGWLTENYSWRWVFYINLPVGMLALGGILAFMPETVKNIKRRFDFTGFILLSLSIGALQMMLDRGESQDWFSSPEIIAAATAGGLSFYLFIVHVMTTDRPFLEPAMFADRNYATSLVLMFIMGIILLATMALLPPYLQNLMGYPAITTGMVMAPRGVGTMFSMMIAGRLINRMDARWIILCGMFLTAASLWEMSLFAPEVPEFLIIKTGVIQGLGLGFVFIPLTTLAYSTLPHHYRNDAAAIFSLMRNIGSSIGISVMFALLARNTQINHADIGAHLLPFGGGAEVLRRIGDVTGGTSATAGLAFLNAEVTRQAAAISFLNNFRVMALILIMAMPLLLFIRGRRINESQTEMEDRMATAIE